jgi:hypothetical protein
MNAVRHGFTLYSAESLKFIIGYVATAESHAHASEAGSGIGPFRQRAYVVLGAEYKLCMADFTLSDTLSVSCTVKPAVEITSPMRISSGWHLMW